MIKKNVVMKILENIEKINFLPMGVKYLNKKKKKNSKKKKMPKIFYGHNTNK